MAASFYTKPGASAAIWRSIAKGKVVERATLGDAARRQRPEQRFGMIHMFQGERVLYADLYVAAKCCRVMPDLILRRDGGLQDASSLGRLKEVAARLAFSVEDVECRQRAATIIHLAADLSSTPEHADFLRRRTLREIESLQDRLTAIAATRASADQPTGGGAHTSS